MIEKNNVVAVFDTAFYTQVHFNPNDGITFVESFMKFLDDSPDVFVLFKTKKSMEGSFNLLRVADNENYPAFFMYNTQVHS